MRLLIALLTLLVVHFPASNAQDATVDISGYLSRIDRGEANKVREELPSLLTKYPNNPAVLYLQGVLTTDGTDAVRVYQSVVDNFPKSEWADDALFKVYQFYYALGLYRTAEIKMNQLRTDYPQSKHIADVSTQSLPEEKETPVTRDSVTPKPGVAPTVKPPVPGSEPAQPIAADRGLYTLQVGAYSQQVNAEKQKLFFEDLGYSVEVINKVHDARSLFVVLVGEYKTPDQARAKGDEIRKTYNINSMVVTR
jgi:cell division septation protein DedD